MIRTIVLSLLLLAVTPAIASVTYLGSTGTKPLCFEIYQAPDGRTFAYVGHGGSFSVVDVSDWREPRIIQRIQLQPDLVTDISIHGDEMAVNNGVHAVRIYSLADPETPKELQQITPAFSLMFTERGLFSITPFYIPGAEEFCRYTHFSHSIYEKDESGFYARTNLFGSCLYAGKYKGYVVNQETDEMIPLFTRFEDNTFFTQKDGHYTALPFPHENSVSIESILVGKGWGNLIIYAGKEGAILVDPSQPSESSLVLYNPDIKTDSQIYLDGGYLYSLFEGKLNQYVLNDSFSLEFKNTVTPPIYLEKIVDGVGYGITETFGFQSWPLDSSADEEATVILPDIEFDDIVTFENHLIVHDESAGGGKPEELYQFRIDSNMQLTDMKRIPVEGFVYRRQLMSDGHLFGVSTSEGVNVFEYNPTFGLSDEPVNFVNAMKLNPSGLIESAFIYSGYFYLGSTREGFPFRIYPIENVESGYEVASEWFTPDIYDTIAVDDGMVFVSTDPLSNPPSSNISVYDMSKPESPEAVNVFSGVYKGIIDLTDGVLAQSGAGAMLFDVSDPFSPELISTAADVYSVRTFMQYSRIVINKPYVVQMKGRYQGYERVPRPYAILQFGQWFNGIGEPEFSYEISFDNYRLRYERIRIVPYKNYILIPAGESGLYVFRIGEPVEVDDWALH